MHFVEFSGLRGCSILRFYCTLHKHAGYPIKCVINGSIVIQVMEAMFQNITILIHTDREFHGFNSI